MFSAHCHVTELYDFLLLFCFVHISNFILKGKSSVSVGYLTILTDFYEKFFVVTAAVLISKPLLSILIFPESINKRIENQSTC